ncbi:hypothetical protein [Streptomyces sp. DH12]|uniref:hypothetical protein n=1 Tax=Streptomyces sp. DH12 TaxID=2857010 RepID=UPI001E47FF61|nr:hypothetical protein [Streptomyces sp. DH12]
MTRPDDTPTTQQLPPYSGDDATCAMCSNTAAFTEYRQAVHRIVVEEYNGQTEQRGPLPARLERRCERCDYRWDEALNPAPGVRVATIEEIAYALDQATAPYAVDLYPEVAAYMAKRLTESLYLLVRTDHPMWVPRAGRPPLVPPAGPVEPDTTATAQVPIPLQQRPDVPAGPTGSAPGSASGGES